MSYTDLTLKTLFVLSGNECAFPGCTAPIFDTSYDVMVGQICHIKGKNKGGPRYDQAQSDEERNSYENLLLMCGAHNKIIDAPRTRDRFPVSLLQQYKAEHEAKHQNSVVNDQTLSEFIAAFQMAGSIITTFNQTGGQAAHTIINNLQPQAPQVSLNPELEYHVTNADNIAGIDYYNLSIIIDNDGDTTVRNFRVNVEIPREHMEVGTSYNAEVDSRTPSTTRLFKYPVKDSRANLILDPGERKSVFTLMFSVNKKQYLTGTKEQIKVSVYAEDRLVSRIDKPIAEMLSVERLNLYRGMYTE